MDFKVQCRKGPKKDLIEALTRYYIQHFKLENSRFTLTVSVEKIEQGEQEESGAAMHVGKDIAVRLGSNLTKFELLKVFGHEMIHVKQIARGQLKLIPSRTGFNVFWLGKKMKPMPYLERPWEIEALSGEEILFRKMTDHFTSLQTA